MFSGGSGRPYLVEGVGEDFFPAAWAARAVRRGDRHQRRGELPHRPPRVARSRASSSAGRAAWRSPRPSRSPSGPGPTTSSSCSTPTPGAATSRGCSTTSGWPTSASSGSATSASAPCSTRGPAWPSCCTSTPTRPCAQAIELMRANGVSQLPVCKNTPPFAAAEVSGSVDELEVMEAIARDPSVMSTPVEQGDGPEAADDRRRPAGRAGRQDARGRPGAARALRRAAAGRGHPHRHPQLLPVGGRRWTRRSTVR